MIFSLNKAAAAAHKSKAAILEQINSGRLSAYMNPETKRWEIESSELFRVNPRKPLETTENQFQEVIKEPVKPASITLTPHPEPVNTTIIELMDRERKSLLDTIADLRDRLDKSQTENSKLTTMLLTHQPVVEQPEKKQPKSNKSWVWGLLSAILIIICYLISQYYFLSKNIKIY